MSSAPKQRERSARDLYVTPVGVTEALLDELERTFGWGPGMKLRILDVGAGTGRITAACRAQWPEAYITAVEIDHTHKNALEAAGATDVWICDFLDQTWGDEWREYDLIVGNPPYSLALPFLQQCLAFKGGAPPYLHAPLIALLVNMNFLGSDGRVDWFEAHAAQCHAIRTLAPRPSFTHEETGKLQTDSVEYAWWLWSNEPDDTQAFDTWPSFGWYLWRTTAKRQKANAVREEVAAEQ